MIPSAAILAAALAFAPTAFPKPETPVQRFGTGKHAKATDRTTVHMKTGVITDHVEVSEKGGKAKAVSEKEIPAVGGGYTMSETVKSFGKVSRTATSRATASASHTGGEKGWLRFRPIKAGRRITSPRGA